MIGLTVGVGVSNYEAPGMAHESAAVGYSAPMTQRIPIVQGDITCRQVDAIVNAGCPDSGRLRLPVCVGPLAAAGRARP